MTIILILFSKVEKVEKESESAGLEKEDAINQARWRVGIGEIVVRRVE